LLKPGGLLIVETAMSWLSDKPAMVLNSETQESMESSTYWMPTSQALIGMVRLCHFEVLGGRWQPDIGRGAVIGQAVPAGREVNGSNTLTRAMHQHGLLDYPFVEELKIADARPASTIKFQGSYRE